MNFIGFRLHSIGGQWMANRIFSPMDGSGFDLPQTVRLRLGSFPVSARTNNVDPLDWLSQTLTRIAQGWPVSEMEALMLWTFKSDAINSRMVNLSLTRSEISDLVAYIKSQGH